MAKFRIFETKQFLADLDKDFSGQKKRIRAKLESYVYVQLRENPYFGKNIKQLRNYTPQTWRYRIGDYRFFYTINPKTRIIFLLTIDHRGEAY